MSGISATERGPSDAPALVLLHGFLGSAANWIEVQDALAGAFHVIALDLPGHGRTTARPAGIDEMVELLEQWARGRRLGHAHLLGYSLGGRIALAWALAHPQRWRSLTLESASAGIEDEGERATRRAEDDARAARLSALGLEAFVADWERLPLFSSQQRLSEQARARLRALRLQGTAERAAYAVRAFSPGRQAPLWEKLPTLALPVHLVGGALDPQYVRVLERMADKISGAALSIISDAGHSIHLERADAYVRVVYEFLHRVENERRCSHASTSNDSIRPIDRLAP